MVTKGKRGKIKQAPGKKLKVEGSRQKEPKKGTGDPKKAEGGDVLIKDAGKRGTGTRSAGTRRPSQKFAGKRKIRISQKRAQKRAGNEIVSQGKP